MRILLIDDEENDTVQLRYILKSKIDKGWALIAQQSLRNGLRDVVEQEVDLILLDLSFPSTKDEPFSTAQDTINLIPPIAPVAPVCIITGHDEEAGLWKPCIDAGAMNYFVKQYYFSIENKVAFFHGLNMAALLHPHRFKK